MTISRRAKRLRKSTPIASDPRFNFPYPFPFPKRFYHQEVDITSPVVPGQPLTAKFVLYTYSSADDWGTGYRIKLYFERSSREEVLIYQNPLDAGAWLPFVHWRAPYAGAPPPAEQPIYMIDPAQYLIDWLDQFPPGSPIGDQFYQFGTKQLRCEIETNGPDMLVFSQTANVDVVPCGRQQFWWSWAQTNLPAADWKQDYTLSGSVTDPNPYVGMQISVSLMESDGDGNKKNYGSQEVSVYPSPPATPVTISFPPIAQDWTWIIDGIWLPETSELTKEFNYIALIAATDTFGNSYDLTPELTPWMVTVSVPQKKISEGAAAFNLSVAAAAVSAVSAILPPLAALAAALTVAAQVLGAYAADPPTPVPNYLDKVEVPRSKVAALKVTGDLVPVQTLLEKIEGALLHLLSLSEIESRYLGAVAAKSRKGARVQSQAASVMRAKIANFAGLIHLAVPEAMKALEPYSSKIEPALKSHRFGLAEEKAIHRLRLPKGTRKRLIEHVRSASFKKLTQTPGFLSALILDSAMKTADVCKAYGG